MKLNIQHFVNREATVHGVKQKSYTANGIHYPVPTSPYMPKEAIVLTNELHAFRSTDEHPMPDSYILGSR